MENSILLKKVPLFSSLRMSELQRLSKKVEVQHFEKEEVICREGEPSSQNFYVVAAGQLNVFLGDKIITTLSSPNYFGEVSLLSGEAHSATIKAVSRGKLLVIKKEVFEEMAGRHPEVLLWLSRALGKKIHETAQFSHKVEHERKIFIVLSSEKGIGKSVLAANLAASYLKQTGKKAAILDYCFSPESVTAQLKLEPALTLSHYNPKEKEITYDDLLSCTLRHHSGVEVLVFHKQGEEIGLEKEVLAPLFKILRQVYEIVIVDVPSHLYLSQLKVLAEEADEIIFLVGDEDISLRKGKSYLDSLEVVYSDLPSKLWLGVLARGRAPLVKRRKPFRFVLPFEPATVKAYLEKGEPFAEVFSTSPLSSSIGRLAREIGNIRIGLALSAGMASGLAHIGVLKVLQRENIPIDMVAGTSGGALYGIVFSAGIPLVEVQRSAERISKWWMFFLVDFTFPYAGFIQGSGIVNFVKPFVGRLHFEDLAIPFKVITTDFSTGEVFVIEKGPVLPALRATISVPGIFAPCRFGDRYLVDGATISPVPVDTLYYGGADKVIAVDTCTDPYLAHKEAAPRRFPPHFFDVITHSRAITSHHLAEIESWKADLAIHPDTSSFKWRDYHRAAEIIEAGEKAAEEALPKIREIFSLGS